jgi:hypothetical protein
MLLSQLTTKVRARIHINDESAGLEQGHTELTDFGCLTSAFQGV